MNNNTVSATARTLVLFACTVVLLQGCAALSTSIELTDDSDNAKLASFDMEYSGGISLIRGVSKISDSAFVVGVHSDTEKGILLAYDHMLQQSWSAHFDMNEDESSPAVWYHKGKVSVITELYDRDTITYIGRQFSAADGQFQSKKNLLAVAIDDEDLDDNSTYYYYSPDSSYMLIVMNTGEFEDSDDHEDMIEFQAHLIVVPQDFSSVRREKVVVLMQEDHEENKWPSFAINNLGDVFYASYDMVNNDVKQMLIRLPARGMKPDTLSITSPKFNYRGDDAYPGTALIDVLTDDVVSLAWHQNADDETACVSVSRFDFASRKVMMSKDVVLTEEEMEALVDDDVLEDYRLLRCLNLPDGGSILVLDEQTFHAVKSGTGLNAHIIGYYAVAGPLIVLRLDAAGNIKWKSSLKEREEPFLMGGSYENFPSMWLTGNSLRMLYRTRAEIEGISYAEFMLNNGEVRTAELPVSYGNMAVFLPRVTQWTHGDQVSIIGRGGGGGQIIKLKLPATQPLVQE